MRSRFSCVYFLIFLSFFFSFFLSFLNRFITNRKDRKLVAVSKWKLTSKSLGNRQSSQAPEGTTKISSLRLIISHPQYIRQYLFLLRPKLDRPSTYRRWDWCLTSILVDKLIRSSDSRYTKKLVAKENSPIFDRPSSSLWPVNSVRRDQFRLAVSIGLFVLETLRLYIDYPRKRAAAVWISG